MAGRSKLLTYGLPAVALFAVVTAVASIGRNAPSRTLAEPVNLPPMQPSDAPPATGAPRPAAGGRTNPAAQVARFIGASGVVESSSEEISIAPRIAGVVSTVYVKAGAKVNKGDPLFQIDPRDYEIALMQAEANLNLAKAELPEKEKAIEQQRAVVEQNLAAIDSYQAEFVRAEKDRTRATSLIDKGAVTFQRLDSSVSDAEKAAANLRSGRAALLAAQRQVEVLQTQRLQSGAKVKQSEVQRAKAQLDLENTTTRSPIDGSVLQVRVRPGQAVETRILDTPLLVVGNVDILHVRADIDEVDIPRFSAGQTAVVTPRGAALRKIAATYVRTEPLVVAKKSLTGASSERVDTRVLQVIFSVAGPEAMLFPGQQIDLYIDTTAVVGSR